MAGSNRDCRPPQPNPGDYIEFYAIEFYAEMDLLVVSSNCPYGDQSTPVVDAALRPLGI